jgi:Spy/CpxP family protein refolding chaperone
MRLILTAMVAATALSAALPANASWRHHHHWWRHHHHHCAWRHHHRVCWWG